LVAGLQWVFAKNKFKDELAGLFVKLQENQIQLVLDSLRKENIQMKSMKRSRSEEKILKAEF